MYIKNLKLFNYRNYSSLNIDFSKNFNIIYGNNAQGKTNILEAIFLCASGRSHRTSKDIDLVKMGESFFLIKLDMTKEGNDSSIEIHYDKNQKKKIRINEIPIRKFGHLMGHLNAVIFSPEDLLIIKEGPSERRRFFDITLSQLRPSYFYDLQQYSKILVQRNNLLKEIQTRKNLIDTLDIWNFKLLDIGSRIIKARYEFLINISNKANINHKNITNGSENLIIKYSPSFFVSDYSNLESIKNDFTKIIEKNLNKELQKGSTMFGPQRDDYELFLNELEVKLYGSQGQQRTSVLSIKLAEIDLMKEETGEYPVLLLDDVMSELDKKRQDYLVENLLSIQTFITSTEKDFFNKNINSDKEFFNISKGEIVNS